MSITYKQQKDPLKTSIDPRINELTNMTRIGMSPITINLIIR